jgi:flagellar biosynthesis protein FliQ
MDTAEVINIGREALLIATMTAAPVLLIALIVGLVIGILQAATSVQEMTLSFIPKLFAMTVALAIFGEWQLTLMVDYFRRMFEKIQYMFLI